MNLKQIREIFEGQLVVYLIYRLSQANLIVNRLVLENNGGEDFIDLVRLGYGF